MVSPIFDNNWKTTQVADAPKRRTTERVRPVAPSAGRRVARRSHRWHLTQGVAEAAVLFLVIALLLVYAGTAIGERVLRPSQVPVVTVEVQPGDTLWSLAERYGYPNEYILKRIDRLSAYNNLPAGARLQPGQVIEVPVENPAEQQRILASGRSTE